MFKYLLRRLFMMIPTLFGITLVSFLIINMAPGGPVEQRIQELTMEGAARGGSGVPVEVVEALNRQYGFDKPVLERYQIWLGRLSHFDFGTSFRFEEPVTQVIVSKLPTSILFGVATFLLVYLVSIPLGVMKAVNQGSSFDWISSLFLFVGYAIPPLILGILLLVFIAGSSGLDWFPLQGMHSDNFSELGIWAKVMDQLRHMVLPLVCYLAGAFTFQTLLMKNAMLEVLQLEYVRTARAKGLSPAHVHLKHALRNALIPMVTGMNFVLKGYFAHSVLIERIFNIDGMGQLGFTAVGSRDYNVLMGLIFVQSVLFMFGRLVTDILYAFVDPRIELT